MNNPPGPLPIPSPSLSVASGPATPFTAFLQQPQPSPSVTPPPPPPPPPPNWLPPPPPPPPTLLPPPPPPSPGPSSPNLGVNNHVHNGPFRRGRTYSPTRSRSHSRTRPRLRGDVLLKPLEVEELEDLTDEELLYITEYDLYKRQRQHLENFQAKANYSRMLERAIQEFPDWGLLIRRKPKESTTSAKDVEAEVKGLNEETKTPGMPNGLPKLDLPSPGPASPGSGPGTPSTYKRSHSPGAMFKNSGDTSEDLERRQIQYFMSTMHYKMANARIDSQIAVLKGHLEQLGVFDYLRRAKQGEKGLEPRIATEVRSKLEALRKLKEEKMKEHGRGQVLSEKTKDNNEDITPMEARDKYNESVPDIHLSPASPTKATCERRSFISRLPSELLMNIFSYLQGGTAMEKHNSDTYAVALTCRRWNEIIIPMAYKVIVFGENSEEAREVALKTDKEQKKWIAEEEERRNKSEAGIVERKRRSREREGKFKDGQDGDSQEEEFYQETTRLESHLKRQLREERYVKLLKGGVCLIGMKYSIGVMTALQNPKLAKHVKEVKYNANSATCFPNEDVLHLYKGPELSTAFQLRRAATDRLCRLVKSATRHLVSVEELCIAGGNPEIANALMGVLRWSPRLNRLYLQHLNIKHLDVIRGHIQRNPKGKGFKEDAQEDNPRTIHPCIEVVEIINVHYGGAAKRYPPGVASQRPPSWIKFAYKGAQRLVKLLDQFPNIKHLEMDGCNIPLEPVLNSTIDQRGKVYFPKRPVIKAPAPGDPLPIAANDSYIPDYSRSRSEYYEPFRERYPPGTKVRKLNLSKLTHVEFNRRWVCYTNHKDMKVVPGDWLSSPGWEEFFLSQHSLKTVGFHGGILSRHKLLDDFAFKRVATHLGRTLKRLAIMHDTTFKPAGSRHFYTDVPHLPHGREFNLPRFINLLKYLPHLEELELAVIHPGMKLRHAVRIAEALKGNKMKTFHLHRVNDVLTLEQTQKLVEYLPNIESLYLISQVPYLLNAYPNVLEDEKVTTVLPGQPATITIINQFNDPNPILAPLQGPPAGVELAGTQYTYPLEPKDSPGSSDEPSGGNPEPSHDALQSFDFDVLLRTLSPLKKLENLIIPYIYPAPIELAHLDMQSLSLHLNRRVKITKYDDQDIRNANKWSRKVKREYLRAIERVGRGFCSKEFHSFADVKTDTRNESMQTEETDLGKKENHNGSSTDAEEVSYFSANIPHDPSSHTSSLPASESKHAAKLPSLPKTRIWPNLRNVDIRYFCPEECFSIRLLSGGRGWFCYDRWSEGVRTWAEEVVEKGGSINAGEILGNEKVDECELEVRYQDVKFW